jgi:hypothetical protein
VHTPRRPAPRYLLESTCPQCILGTKTRPALLDVVAMVDERSPRCHGRYQITRFMAVRYCALLRSMCGSGGVAHPMDVFSAVFTVPSNVSLRRMQGPPSHSPTLPSATPDSAFEIIPCGVRTCMACAMAFLTSFFSLLPFHVFYGGHAHCHDQHRDSCVRVIIAHFSPRHPLPVSRRISPPPSPLSRAPMQRSHQRHGENQMAFEWDAVRSSWVQVEVASSIGWRCTNGC